MVRRVPPRLWVACAILALAPACLARAEGAPVRVPLQVWTPRAGAVLTAGTTAELAWSPAEPSPAFEEWEAFLSLDGGQTYPMRITPHLDRSLRRIRWQVPPTPTRNARILLRIGDERRETAVELPLRFVITASPATLRATW